MLPAPRTTLEDDALPREAGGYSVMAEAEWRSLASDHRARADAYSAAHLARRSRGRKHPVEDFLWTYYSVRPSELRKWHPGAGVVLEHAGRDRASWHHYRAVGAGNAARANVHGGTADAASGSPAATPSAAHATVDLAAYFARRSPTVDYIETLLRNTLGATPRFGCFGLHEWTMVYRLTPERLRHRGPKLRVGHAETDRVVEANPIACSHFDAYHFFTPDAAPLNELRPARETQPDMEQAACLHAGMDIYKWAVKLGPIVPGEILLDCFELARDIREVDMRASPYDVAAYPGWGGEALAPIPIETPRGKRQHAELQRGFAERGNRLRERVLAAIAVARASRAAPDEVFSSLHAVH